MAQLPHCSVCVCLDRLLTTPTQREGSQEPQASHNQKIFMKEDNMLLAVNEKIQMVGFDGDYKSEVAITSRDVEVLVLY